MARRLFLVWLGWLLLSPAALARGRCDLILAQMKSFSAARARGDLVNFAFKFNESIRNTTAPGSNLKDEIEVLLHNVESPKYFDGALDLVRRLFDFSFEHPPRTRERALLISLSDRVIRLGIAHSEGRSELEVLRLFREGEAYPLTDPELRRFVMRMALAAPHPENFDLSAMQGPYMSSPWAQLFTDRLMSMPFGLHAHEVETLRVACRSEDENERQNARELMVRAERSGQLSPARYREMLIAAGEAYDRSLLQLLLRSAHASHQGVKFEAMAHLVHDPQHPEREYFIRELVAQGHEETLQASLLEARQAEDLARLRDLLSRIQTPAVLTEGAMEDVLIAYLYLVKRDPNPESFASLNLWEKEWYARVPQHAREAIGAHLGELIESSEGARRPALVLGQAFRQEGLVARVIDLASTTQSPEARYMLALNLEFDRIPEPSRSSAFDFILETFEGLREEHQQVAVYSNLFGQWNASSLSPERRERAAALHDQMRSEGELLPHHESLYDDFLRR
jgi:hypothetical protein